jgi:hypothetical protein
VEGVENKRPTGLAAVGLSNSTSVYRVLEAPPPWRRLAISAAREQAAATARIGAMAAGFSWTFTNIRTWDSYRRQPEVSKELIIRSALPTAQESTESEEAGVIGSFDFANG